MAVPEERTTESRRHRGSSEQGQRCYSAAARIWFSSAGDRVIGFGFMLLACAAFSARIGKASGVIPYAPRPGMESAWQS